MKQSFRYFELLRIPQIPVFFFGGLLAAIILISQFDILATFTQSRYERFWEDAVAYHLRSEGHKTLPALYEEYGTHYVHNHVAMHPLTAAFAPSDDAALAYYVGNAVQEQDGVFHRRSDWIGIAVLVYAIGYLPIAAYVGALIRNMTWVFCRSDQAALRFAERFDSPFHRRITGALAAFPLVILLAAIGAWFDWSDDLRRVGFTFFDLTVIGVFQSYVGGLGIRLVRGFIDGVFIAFGKDADRLLIDDILAVAITGPILVLVYGNSPISILADTAAGIGPVLIARALAWRAARRAGPLDVEAAADGPGAINRNIFLAAASAVPGLAWFCCGLMVYGGGVEQYRSVPLSVAEFEDEGPGDHKAVELSGGYLFWPMLVEVPPPAGLDGKPLKQSERYMVPLVSRPVLDEWLAIYRKDRSARYPMSKCRAVVSFIPAEFSAVFPDVRPDRFGSNSPFVAHDVNGTIEPFAQKIQRERKPLESRARESVPDSLLIVRYREDVSLLRHSFLFAAVLGLLGALPLPLRGIISGFRHRSRRQHVVVAKIPTVELVTPITPRRSPKKRPEPDPVPVVEAVEAEPVETVAPVDDEPRFLFSREGQTRGPVSMSRLRELARSGQLRPSDMVQVRGKWFLASEVPGVFDR